MKQKEKSKNEKDRKNYRKKNEIERTNERTKKIGRQTQRLI